MTINTSFTFIDILRTYNSFYLGDGYLKKIKGMFPLFKQ